MTFQKKTSPTLKSSSVGKQVNSSHNDIPEENESYTKIKFSWQASELFPQ